MFVNTIYVKKEHVIGHDIFQIQGEYLTIYSSNNPRQVRHQYKCMKIMKGAVELVLVQICSKQGSKGSK